MITYTELFALCALIVAVIKLVLSITGRNKQRFFSIKAKKNCSVPQPPGL